MKKFVLSLSVLVFLAIVFSGCQSLGGLSAMVKEPVVSIRSVEVTKAGIIGVDLLCKVNVENPNAVDISFPELDWELFINGGHFVNGTIKNNNPLRAGQTTVVDVPVRLNYLDIFRVFSSIRGSAQANYKIALGLKFNLPVLGSRILHLDHQGVLPLN